MRLTAKDEAWALRQLIELAIKEHTAAWKMLTEIDAL